MRKEKNMCQIKEQDKTQGKKKKKKPTAKTETSNLSNKEVKVTVIKMLSSEQWRNKGKNFSKELKNVKKHQS